MKQKTFRTKFGILATAAGAILVGVFFVSAYATTVFAFNGPSQNPPSGSGAIGSDASNNVGVGTATTISGTKLTVVGASSDNTTYVAQFLKNNSTPIFILRDDGSLSIATSTVSAGNTVIGGNLTVGGTFVVNNLTGLISSGNVTPGTFNSNNGSGGGNYAFPASLGVNTSTQVGLPQSLSVYGGGYFSGNVGIGTTAPLATLSIQEPASGSGGQTIFNVANNSGTSVLSVYGGSGGANYVLANSFTQMGKGIAFGWQANNDIDINSTGFLRWNTGSDATVNSYDIGLTRGAAGKLYVGNGTAGNYTGTLIAGNVGIGTTTPAYPLTVNGTTSATAYCINGANCITSWPSGGGGVTSVFGRTGVVVSASGDYAVGQITGAAPLASPTFTGTVTMPGTHGSAQFLDGGGDAASYSADTLELSGWNGLGMYNPTAGGAYANQISGFYDFRNGFWDTKSYPMVNGTAINSIFAPLASPTFTGSISFPGSGIWNSSGNVGIGTTAPQSILHIVGNEGAPSTSGNMTNGVIITGVLGGPTLNLGTTMSGGTYSWITSAYSNNAGVYLPLSLQPNGGNVGIGTTAPGYTLTVNGTGDFTGKLTANTIDPLYTIGGTNYSTYVPGMTGEKEETAGTVDLQKNADGTYSDTMDFATAAKGSDLWLFAQATNLANTMDQLIVSLTPSFDGTVWYTKNASADTLTLHGSAAGEVSYNLTAPRFDAAQWPNLAPADESSTTGLIINTQ